MKEVPIVSVVMITYGHENFIAEAINSVLLQECDFQIELIIANDCSPDGTDNVVKSILKNNTKSHQIKYIKHQNNIGMLPNFIFACKESTGKYIAFCEGDDYWTDSYKLQKQVNFLESNIDYNLVGHYSISSDRIELGKFSKDSFTFEDIYQKNLRIPTASILFRNNITYPRWIYSVYGGDRAIIFLNAQKGKLKILPFFGSFYRIHMNSVEHNLKKDKFKVAIRNIKEEIIYYDLLKKEKDVSIIKKRILKNHYYMIALGIKKIQVIKFLKALRSLIYFYLYNKVKF